MTKSQYPSMFSAPTRNHSMVERTEHTITRFQHFTAELTAQDDIRILEHFSHKLEHQNRYY